MKQRDAHAPIAFVQFSKAHEPHKRTSRASILHDDARSTVGENTVEHQKAGDWTYDRDAKRLVVTTENALHHRHQFLMNAGRVTLDQTEVRACDIGLHVRVATGHSHYEHHTIPGEYQLEAVANYLQTNNAVPDGATFWSDLLLETELWEARGLLDDPKEFPKALIDRVPLEVFLRGGLKSRKQWMEKAVYDDPIFQNVGKSRTRRFVENGQYPEKLHAMKNWMLFEHRELLRIIRYDARKIPVWGMFCSQKYAFFKPVLDAHDEAWEEIGDFVHACMVFPRTERVRTLLDDIYRLGGNLSGCAKRFSRVDDLVGYRDALIEREALRPPEPRSVLEDYVHPDVELPRGWIWADSENFWKLGEKFNCCINDNGTYAKQLADGSAACAFVQKFDLDKGDEGGLAFFRQNATGTTWRVSQVKAWSNRRVDDKRRNEAETIAARIPARSKQDKKDEYESRRTRARELAKRRPHPTNAAEIA